MNFASHSRAHCTITRYGLNLPDRGSMAKALLHLMCFMLRDESCDVRFEKQAAYAFYSTASNPKDLANYIRHAVVQDYGAENYLSRLCITLRDPRLVSQGYSLMHILNVQTVVLENKVFTPYFASSGVLHALCDILAREVKRETPVPGPFPAFGMTESMLNILGLVSMYSMFNESG